MANKPTSSAGTIIGLVLSVVLVGGIAGTPFYLASLQTDAMALDKAVRDDVETLRRVVLNLNAHLEPIQQASKLTDGDGKPAKQDMSQFLAANDKLLNKAEEIVKKLRDVRQGALLADGQLAVAQVKAILYLNVGKIHGNRAEFEESMATETRHAAEERLGIVGELQRGLDAAEAQNPAAAITQIQDLLRKTEAGIAGPEKEIARLGGEIKDLDKKITHLEETAVKAQEKMAAMKDRPWSAQHEQAYGELSDEARKAEAEAASLRDGSIEGGKVVFSGGEDWIEATYEGGKPLLGVATRKARLEDLKETVAVLEKLKAGLEERQKDLESQTSAIQTEKANLLEKKNAQIKMIDEMLAVTEQHAKAAAEAREQALTALEKKALNFAKIGVKAAKDRTRDAASALSQQGDAADECLKRISKDGETEAALNCLTADTAYAIAVIRLHQLNALQAAYDSQVYVAKVTGREPPPVVGGQLDEIRTKAAEDLKLATDMFKEARKLIKPTSLRTADGTTISGANCVWQVDVGQAAIHILEANLSGDRSVRLDALRKADELLREAAKDRDQSPLLGPAVETLQYLQRTAK